MAVVTVENLTGGTVSLRLENEDLIDHLRKLVGKGDLVSIEVADDVPRKRRTRRSGTPAPTPPADDGPDTEEG